MSNKIYSPDKWLIIRLKDNLEAPSKVLGGWAGGYLDSDYWRLSSGIKSVVEEGDYYIVNNFSGSTYRCNKKSEGTTVLSGSILSSMQKEASVEILKIESFLKEFKI